MQQNKSFRLKTALIIAATPFLAGAEKAKESGGFDIPAGVLWGMAGVGLVAIIFALLLKFAPKGEFKERSFWQNIRFKIPIIIVLSAIIWFAAGKFGFPIWWQIEFVAFALVGFCFFVLLDLPAFKQEKTTFSWVFRLIVTYALASGIFIVMTAQLPQFDPQVEFDAIFKPPLKLEAGAKGPEVVAAGREVFESNKCFNCHKVFWEGNSDRGPNLGSKQIGLYSVEYIRGQILDPRKNQSPGFEDKKSKKAMPTYYEEDLSEDEIVALIAFLKTLKDPTHVPVEGKFPNQWTWWDDPKIIAEGKEVFEGKNPLLAELTGGALNCAVCHGAAGIPLMTGAFDFRDPEGMDTDKMPDHVDIPLKDWPDELYYRRVTRGIDTTAMIGWGILVPHLYLWKAEVYARTFHDPLEKRNGKKPLHSIPTKEEIAKWRDHYIGLNFEAPGMSQEEIDKLTAEGKTLFPLM